MPVLRRTLDKFAQITTRLTAMVDRFTSMFDCADTGLLPDGILDQLPAPAKIAGTRIGGIDMNIPRVRAGLAAVGGCPGRVIVARFTAQLRAMTGQTPDDYSTRQAPTTCANCEERSSSPNPAAPAVTTYPATPRTITALLTDRDKVPAPLIAESGPHDEAAHPTTGNIDREYETASTCKTCSTTSTNTAAA